jgi:phenylalanyl-tRNA synthetase beta chain
VVDVSNYVMLELGKPIHTYDADGVATDDDGPHRLVVRRAVAGERLETIDHVTRPLDGETLLIADARGPNGIAGIMGGAASEVSDATTRVIVESAIFDPILIRRTGQRYGLRSEASLRFEKGQETRLARIGADRAARLAAEWAGGSVARGRVDSNPAEPEATRIPFRPSRVNRLLGIDLTADEQSALLDRVGVATAPPASAEERTIPVAAGSRPLSTQAIDEEVVVAVVPTWRRDIAIEADVAEEVARVRGYETIPETLPDTSMPPHRPSPLGIRDRIRETLAGAGLTEAVTHALVSPAQAERWVWSAETAPVHGGTPAGGRPIHVTNPLSMDHSVLRQSVTGSLVEIAASNLRHGREDVAIHEVGKGYGDDDGVIREWWRVAIALTGSAEEPSWNRAARAYDLDDAKGVIELVCRRLGLDAPCYAPLSGEPLLHPGRAAIVTAEAAAGGGAGGSGGVGLAGVVGELHPAVADSIDLRGARLIVAEIDIAGLSGAAFVDRDVTAPPRHPPIERDLAVVVRNATPAADVERAIRDGAGAELVSLRLFDVYRGVPLGGDEKSLAWRLVFQAPERTLTDAEVDESIARITRTLGSIGGRIRT